MRYDHFSYIQVGLDDIIGVDPLPKPVPDIGGTLTLEQIDTKIGELVALLGNFKGDRDSVRRRLERTSKSREELVKDLSMNMRLKLQEYDQEKTAFTIDTKLLSLYRVRHLFKVSKKRRRQREEADNCAICMQPLPSAPVSNFPCGHPLHSRCYAEFSSNHTRQRCPTCRQCLICDDECVCDGESVSSQASLNRSFRVLRADGGGDNPENAILNNLFEELRVETENGNLWGVQEEMYVPDCRTIEDVYETDVQALQREYVDAKHHEAEDEPEDDTPSMLTNPDWHRANLSGEYLASLNLHFLQNPPFERRLEHGRILTALLTGGHIQWKDEDGKRKVKYINHKIWIQISTMRARRFFESRINYYHALHCHKVEFERRAIQDREDLETAIIQEAVNDEERLIQERDELREQGTIATLQSDLERCMDRLLGDIAYALSQHNIPAKGCKLSWEVDATSGSASIEVNIADFAEFVTPEPESDDDEEFKVMNTATTTTTSTTSTVCICVFVNFILCLLAILCCVFL